MRAILASVAALVLACGSSTTAPPPPPTDSGGGSGGSGGGDSGGGGSGGGDTSGGGGSTPGGGGSGGGDTSGGGGGSTSGGGGSAGGGGAPGAVSSPDGSAVIEAIDQGGECASLLPTTAPAAVTVRAAGGACGGAITDGGGRLAVMTDAGSDFAQWLVLRDGGPAGSFRVSRSRPDLPTLFPQESGFQGAQVVAVPSPSEVHVVTFSGDGALVRDERATDHGNERDNAQWIQVEDPRGGTALVSSGWAHRAEQPCMRSVVRVDASGAVRPHGWTWFGHETRRSAGTCDPEAAGVSAQGDALAIEPDQGLAWLWWVPPNVIAVPKASASSAGSWAALFSRDAPVRLAPLLDGSLVASEGGVWTRRFAYHADRAEDAPGWLASRSGFTFRNTRGNRGYALLPPEGAASADCSQRIEIVAPTGRLCGTVTLKGDGGSCTTAAVDQGWDGTVVQQGARDRCSWRTWPRLLAGD